MIRVIANTTTKLAGEMNKMVGKTFKNYSRNPFGNYIIRTDSGNSWWFLERDIELVEESEDDKLRELLL